jgi:hypothetical protein
MKKHILQSLILVVCIVCLSNQTEKKQYQTDILRDNYASESTENNLNRKTKVINMSRTHILWNLQYTPSTIAPAELQKKKWNKSKQPSTQVVTLKCEESEQI